MKDKISVILDTLGSMRVDGWDNHEKLVYVKLMLEQLLRDEGEENGE